MSTVQDLNIAAENKDGEQLRKALAPFFGQKVPSDVVPILCQVIVQEWHQEHEDIALILQVSRDSRAVAALTQAAPMRFDHLLKWNNLHEFQRKCTWAIADIGTPQAKESLIELSSHTDECLASYATERLENWNSELNRKGPSHRGA